MSNEALLWAIKNNDLEQVKTICGQSGFDVNAEISNGRAPLHHAADYGHEDVVKYLLSKGANVDAPDKHGISPLLSAVYESHVECVKALLEGGADKSQQTPDGMSLYDVAETEELRALLQ